MGSIWDGFGRDLEAFGASWAVLVPLFFMLVFGVVFKSALGGIRAGFCFDFEGFGMDFGKILCLSPASHLERHVWSVSG